MGEARQAPQPGGAGMALLSPDEEDKFLADWGDRPVPAS